MERRLILKGAGRLCAAALLAPFAGRAAASLTVAAALNKAGRQRMLSQRMAKFYLFQAWGINAPAARMELNWARAEFSSVMPLLYSAAQEVPAARTPLAELESQWVAYRDALATGRSGPQVAALAAVAGQSERILATAEQLVTLFEQHSTAA